MFRNLVASSSLPFAFARVPVSRPLSTTARALAKAPLGPTPSAPTPLDLLTKLGRGAEKRLAAAAESWEALNALWMRGGEGVRESGLSPRDRRYVLWAFSRYSEGTSLDEVVRKPTPAKKIRG